jgi:hypothetical protein
MGEKTLALRVGVDNDDDDDDDEGVEDKVNENEPRLAHQSTESRLQVAVLLQMPSPNHPEANNGINKHALCSVRGELAIGLMEVPWTREGHSPQSSTWSSP